MGALILAIRRRWCLWNAEAIRAEREAYVSAGAAGQDYIENSYSQELAYRRKANAF